MKTKDKKLKTQLFVCTNNSGCAFLGGQKLRDDIKSKLIQKLGVEAYKKNLRINNSGCLGDCSEGIAACLMPQSKFWTELKPSDSDAMVDEVLKALAE
jgi:NADH:ubiquinone oxidoreductase subunit E